MDDWISVGSQATSENNAPEWPVTDYHGSYTRTFMCYRVISEGCKDLSAGQHQGPRSGRQASIVDNAKSSGFYVAGVYREKASEARLDRPELLRMIDVLQPGEAVIALTGY